MSSPTVAVEQKQESPRSPHALDLARRGVRKIRRAPAAFGRRVAGTVARRLEGRLLRLALARPRFATLYYFVADRSFDREIHAVLHGQMAHRDRSHTSAAEAARFTLRRNTHRLEKGLLMRPRRPVFAEGYLEETTTAFADVIGTSTGRVRDDGRFELDPLLRWADDVLGEYFNVVSETEVVRPLPRGLSGRSHFAERGRSSARRTRNAAFRTVAPSIRSPSRSTTWPRWRGGGGASGGSSSGPSRAR